MGRAAAEEAERRRRWRRGGREGGEREREEEGFEVVGGVRGAATIDADIGGCMDRCEEVEVVGAVLRVITSKLYDVSSFLTGAQARDDFAAESKGELDRGGLKNGNVSEIEPQFFY